MRRLALVTTGAAAGLVTLAATLSSAGAVVAAPSPPVYRQTINWKPCPIVANAPNQAYRRLECARIKAPQDWHKPRGKKISLVVSRLAALNGNPKGVIFTNPGGPGGPGIQLPLGFLQRDKLVQNMDIIGLDPRGTGYSTQASCKRVTDVAFGYDFRNRSARNVAGLLRAAKKTAKGCQNGKGLPSRFNNTAQVMYDLDMIRRILRMSKTNAPVNKINWIGYSAGTWMGAHYARYFPKNTGHFVLDSNVDFTSPWQLTFDKYQPKAFERRFRQDFLPWVAKYNGFFKLGTTAAQVRAKYEKLRRVIVRKGQIKYRVNGKVITYYPARLDHEIAMQLYTKGQFRDLGWQIRAMYQVTPGAGARAQTARNAAIPTLKMDSPVGDPQAPSEATLIQVTCNDTPHTKNIKKWTAFANKIAKAYPLTGSGTITSACTFWKRPKQSLKKPIGAGGPNLLMIQSYHDPATAYELGAYAHKRYKNSHLITVRNEGDHGIYASGNGCVDAAVENWIVDGAWPGNGNSDCPGQPLPDPNVQDERSQTGLNPNPILRGQELEGVIGSF